MSIENELLEIWKVIFSSLIRESFFIVMKKNSDLKIESEKKIFFS